MKDGKKFTASERLPWLASRGAGKSKDSDKTDKQTMLSNVAEDRSKKGITLLLALPCSCLLFFGGLAVAIAGSVILADEVETFATTPVGEGLDCCDTDKKPGNREEDCPPFDCGHMERGGSNKCHCVDDLGRIVCKDHRSLARGIAMVVVGGLCFSFVAACSGDQHRHVQTLPQYVDKYKI